MPLYLINPRSSCRQTLLPLRLISSGPVTRQTVFPFSGYSKRFLLTIKGEVTALFQPGRPVLPVKKNTEHRLIPFITTFSRQLGPLKQAIKQHFNSALPQTAPLASFKILMSYRRNKNLQDMLVHTALNKAPEVHLQLSSRCPHLADLHTTLLQCRLRHPVQTMQEYLCG